MYLIIFMPIYLIIRCTYIKTKKIIFNKYHELLLILFFIFIISILIITGITDISNFEFKFNGKLYLIPFSTIITFISIPDKFFVISNILGNIFLFFPIGFLLPLLWQKYKNRNNVILFAFCFSSGIELLQLFLKRETDIDDIILNTSGALIGYLIFILLLNKHYIKYNKILNVRKEYH